MLDNACLLDHLQIVPKQTIPVEVLDNYTRGMDDTHQAPEADRRPGSDATSPGDVTEVLDPFDEEGNPIRPGPPGSEEDGPAYKLIVRTGQQAGRSWRVAPGDTRVGRHPYNDIALDHITVSRSHCLLTLDATGMTLTDLGSTNGTYVNGRRAESTTILPGDELMIGMFRLLLARGR